MALPRSRRVSIGAAASVFPFVVNWYLLPQLFGALRRHTLPSVQPIKCAVRRYWTYIIIRKMNELAQRKCYTLPTSLTYTLLFVGLSLWQGNQISMRLFNLSQLLAFDQVQTLCTTGWITETYLSTARSSMLYIEAIGAVVVREPLDQNRKKNLFHCYMSLRLTWLSLVRVS